MIISVRFAVSVDNATSIIVNAAPKEEMDEGNPEWKNNVLRSVTIQKIDALILEIGKHTLKITMIDSGVVLDKMIIGFVESLPTCCWAKKTVSKRQDRTASPLAKKTTSH